MTRIAPYYKAVVAVLVPFLTALGAALLEDSAGGGAVTPNEWIVSIVAGLVAGGAVFAVPNKDPLAKHQLESVQPPTLFDERGAYDTGNLLVTLACIVFIICGLIFIVRSF